jgi:hypothetical protein
LPASNEIIVNTEDWRYRETFRDRAIGEADKACGNSRMGTKRDSFSPSWLCIARRAADAYAFASNALLFRADEMIGTWLRKSGLKIRPEWSFARMPSALKRPVV